MDIPHLTLQEYLDGAAGENAVLLDVREPEEWAHGHAADARHVPMNSVPATVAHDPDLLPADTTVVVVCKAGGRSAQVTAWLRQHGYDAVNLEGGMLGWASAGRPMISENGETPSIL